MNYKVASWIFEGLREEDRSGYELWRWLDVSLGQNRLLTEADLYPSLYYLEAERLISGRWRDVEPTRRVYRIAAGGAALAAEWGRPAPATQRTTSDPQPPAQAVDSADAAAAEPETPARSRDDYLARLEAALRLCRPQRNSIRIEIEDHLEDCTADLCRAGLKEPDAGARAVTRLGPPETLAESISRAQLTRGRLLAGIPRAAYTAAFAGAMATAAAGVFVFLVPLLARQLVSLAHLLGVHLYVPETGDWRDQQILTATLVGAFMAGRMSLPRLANETRRLETSIARWWAAGVGLLLLVAALLFPILLEPATVVTLLGVPVAFVAGSLRFQKDGDDPASRKGLAAGGAVVALFLLLPGIRTWAYDPAAQGGPVPPSALSAEVSLDWDGGGGFWEADLQGVDPALWQDVRIEIWPAARQGPFVVLDSSSSEPLLVSDTGHIQFSSLRDPAPDLWVTVTAAGGDGQRRTIHAEVHQCDRPHRISQLLFWLLGDR